MKVSDVANTLVSTSMPAVVSSFMSVKFTQEKQCYPKTHLALQSGGPNREEEATPGSDLRDWPRIGMPG